MIDAALDAGITFLDTADIYGGDGASERLIGEVLDGRRDRVVLATKFGMAMGGDDGEPRGSRAYARRAVEASLARLRTDRIDLFHYHEPDGVTPLAETLGALHELVARGRSACTACRTSTPRSCARPPRTATSGSRRSRTSTTCSSARRRRRSCRSAASSASASCRTSRSRAACSPGKFRRGVPAPEGTRLAGRPDRLAAADFDRIEALEAFARERGRTPLELAIAGLAAQPGVASVIAGATRPDQVAANAAAGEWRLGTDDLAALAQR